MGYLGKQLAKNSPWFNFGCWTVMTILIVVYALQEISFFKGIFVAVLALLFLSCIAVESWKQAYRNKHKTEPELSHKLQGVYLAISILFFVLLVVFLIIQFL